MRDKRLFRFLLILSLLIGIACACFPQGFGLSKATVTLHRKLPAVFTLTGTEVAVKVTPTAANTKSLADALGPLVETSMQGSDRRITIENSKPQTLITCNITGYVPPRLQKLTRQNLVPSKKNTQPQQYLKVTGDLTVSYHAKDMRTGKTLDAAVLESKINQDYEANGSKTKSIGEDIESVKKIPGAFHKKHEAEETVPASTEDVNQLMLRDVAAQLARRVVNTDESIQVLLPKGKLESASKLGQSGLWPRMLEELGSVPQFPKKEDEAYRVYGMGVAYEAMGYDAHDPQQAVKLFEQAAVNYGKAIDNDPDEKYFREPQTRIEQALVVLKTLADRAKKGGAPLQEEAAENPPSESSKAAADSKNVQATKSAATTESGTPARDADTLTNETVVDLAKSGMNDENLIANIHDAKRVNFDLSIAGQKQLMQSGVSNAVLAAMRQRAGRSTSTHQPARSTSSSAKNPPKTSQP